MQSKDRMTSRASTSVTAKTDSKIGYSALVADARRKYLADKEKKKESVPPAKAEAKAEAPKIALEVKEAKGSVSAKKPGALAPKKIQPLKK
jgi:hypothetical protein